MALHVVFQKYCLRALKSSDQATKMDIAECLITEPLKRYADNLLLLLISDSCKDNFVSKCAEIEDCMRPSDSCGNLGEVLRFLRENGMENSFTKEDGIATCKAVL